MFKKKLCKKRILKREKLCQKLGETFGIHITYKMLTT